MNTNRNFRWLVAGFALVITAGVINMMLAMWDLGSWADELYVLVFILGLWTALLRWVFLRMQALHFPLGVALFVWGAVGGGIAGGLFAGQGAAVAMVHICTWYPALIINMRWAGNRALAAH